MTAQKTTSRAARLARRVRARIRPLRPRQLRRCAGRCRARSIASHGARGRRRAASWRFVARPGGHRRRSRLALRRRSRRDPSSDRRGSARAIAAPNDVEYAERLLDLHDPPPALFVSWRRDPRAACDAWRWSALATVPRSAVRSPSISAGTSPASGCASSAGPRGASTRQPTSARSPRRSHARRARRRDRPPYPRARRGLLTRIVEARGTARRPSTRPAWSLTPATSPRATGDRGALVAVVVVEGVERSGSRITADHALDLGRDVFAVPGPITSPLTATPHALIRDGAILMRGLDDLFDGLGIARLLAERPPPDLERRRAPRRGKRSKPPRCPTSSARRVGDGDRPRRGRPDWRSSSAASCVP